MQMKSLSTALMPNSATRRNLAPSVIVVLLVASVTADPR
jgi:hypothetical protein